MKYLKIDEAKAIDYIKLSVRIALEARIETKCGE